MLPLQQIDCLDLPGALLLTKLILGPRVEQILQLNLFIVKVAENKVIFFAMFLNYYVSICYIQQPSI